MNGALVGGESQPLRVVVEAERDDFGMVGSSPHLLQLLTRRRVKHANQRALKKEEHENDRENRKKKDETR